VRRRHSAGSRLGGQTRGSVVGGSPLHLYSALRVGTTRDAPPTPFGPTPPKMVGVRPDSRPRLRSAPKHRRSATPNPSAPPALLPPALPPRPGGSLHRLRVLPGDRIHASGAGDAHRRPRHQPVLATLGTAMLVVVRSGITAHRESNAPTATREVRVCVVGPT